VSVKRLRFDFDQCLHLLVGCEQHIV
jgi:hypothetical protein